MIFRFGRGTMSASIRTLFLLVLAAFVGTWPTDAAANNKRYSNDEFNISAVFPSGGRVCPSLSGDHPHGFYAQYHGKPQTCTGMRSKPGKSISAITVYADYNPNYEPLRTPFHDLCEQKEYKPALGAADLKRFSIKGHPGYVCANKRPDGQVEIVVLISNGQWKEEATSAAVPYIFYIVSLTAPEQRLSSDLPMFETFLHSVKIDPRQPNP